MYFDFRKALRRRLLRIRSRFRRLWKNYIYQSFLAVVVVAIVFLLLHIQEAVIIASMGATAFIVFTMPNNRSAHPRRVIGGHVTGLLCGSVAALVIPHATTDPIVVIEYSLAVGLSIFLMVALDVEHPPAAGTALGVAIAQFSPGVALTVLVGSIMLSLAHRFLRRFLRDLV
ncbi:HPP family protein [Chloroflexota bacterium]